MLFSFILLVYFIFTGFLVEPLLVHLFHFKKTWRAGLVGLFLSFSFVGFLAGIFVVFYKLNLPAIGTILAVNIFFILALRRLVKIPVEITIDYPTVEAELTAPNSAWWGVILYLTLAGYGFYLLYGSRSGGNLVTPWQTIDHLYLYVFALATLLLGGLIFSRLSASAVLFFCIVHALLLHSYLPLTHELFYGADQWRHVAVEQRLVAERALESAKLSAPANTLEVKYRLTASGLSVNALAYSSFWGATAFIARAAHVDLITLNKWLVPILWSLLLPLLLFEIGKTLGWSDRASLFLVWLSFLPFTWQAAGALTLPSSFGFLVWLLSVVLLLKRIQDPDRHQLPVLLVFGLLSFFGYSLYLILFWLGWVLAELIIRLKVKNISLRVSVIVGLALLVALVLPAVELVSHYSAFNPDLNWFHQVKQLVGNLSAWYLAAGPQAGDIATGNIIFNQLPLAAFVSNLFTVWRWWLVAFMLLFLAAAGFGFVVCLKKQNKEQQWLAAFGGALFLTYIGARYFLIGENIFTRRLDPVLALFLVIFFVVWLQRFLFPLYEGGAKVGRFVASSLVFLLTVARTAAYSLGPDTGTVSASEYAAMRYVWEQGENNARRCVIADLYPLLALEAISSKDIVGGGFPINQYFSQPELVFLYRNFSASASDWQEALRLTGAKRCAFVGSFFSPGPVSVKQFGNVGVWWYPK